MPTDPAMTAPPPDPPFTAEEIERTAEYWRAALSVKRYGPNNVAELLRMLRFAAQLAQQQTAIQADLQQARQQLAEQRAELTGTLSDTFKSMRECYDTPTDHYREMARRLIENRDEMKHRIRTQERQVKDLTSAVEAARSSLISAWNDGESLYLSMEQAEFVARIDQALAADTRDRNRETTASATTNWPAGRHDSASTVLCKSKGPQMTMHIGLPNRLTPETEAKLRADLKAGAMGWLVLGETLGEIDALRREVALWQTDCMDDLDDDGPCGRCYHCLTRRIEELVRTVNTLHPGPDAPKETP